MPAVLTRAVRAVADGAFMAENLPCAFHAFHYLRRNRNGYPAGSSSALHATNERRRTVMIYPSLFLRRALQLDAIVTGAMALLLVFGDSVLAPPLNLPE